MSVGADRRVYLCFWGTVPQLDCAESTNTVIPTVPVPAKSLLAEQMLVSAPKIRQVAHSAGLKPFRTWNIHKTLALMGKGEISPSFELLGNSAKLDRSCPATVTSVRAGTLKTRV